MEQLIFLLVIAIVIIKVAQSGNNRLPRQSDDYQRGYWDGVRDAQHGRAKIEEDSDGQAKLITEKQATASQPTDPALTSDEEESSKDRKSVV